MKNLLLTTVIVLLTINVSFPQSSWQIVSSPVNENFISICFIDTAHGWIISETGTIISTSDAGISWETNSIPDVYFESIHFSDNNHGCIVGWQETPADSSLILITSDGGINWTMVDHYRVNRFNDVFFINNDIGWAVGAKDDWNVNCCFYTSNGGMSWDYQSSITQVGAKLFGVSFRDENLGSTCGADGAFFITNNGGTQSWAFGIAMPILNLNAIYNWGTLTGCIVGDEGTALYTVNNWYQFIETVTNTTENLNGVSGDPGSNYLWAVGDNGTIIHSPNYLLGWTTQNSGVAENLNDVVMLSQTNGWAVGDNGTILHFSPTTLVSSYNNHNIQIYPNPSNGIFKVHLMKELAFFKLQIRSVKGKLVFETNLPPGNYLSYDLTHFPKGVYFATFINESGPVLERLIIK